MKYLIYILLIGLILSTEAQVSDSVQSGKFQVYYELSGEGSPVYVLSGGPGITPHIMNDVVEKLSKHHLTVLIHQRGTGKTSGPVNAETIKIADYSQDIKAVKEKLGHEKINLLGHSWGGRLAMDYSTRYPKDIKSMILVAPGRYIKEFQKYFAENIRSNLSYEDQKTLQSMDLFFSQMPLIQNDSVMKAIGALSLNYMKINRKGYFYDKSKVEELEISKKDINMQILGLMKESMNTMKSNIEDELDKINVETLIVQGRQDPIDLETARVIQSAIKKSELAIIERCGHFPWIEQPIEFYQLVNTFLVKK